jgi:peptidoglycan/xylan/chitin deacetylase (PgdA/CDA1 family)
VGRHNFFFENRKTFFVVYTVVSSIVIALLLLLYRGGEQNNTKLISSLLQVYNSKFNNHTQIATTPSHQALTQIFENVNQEAQKELLNLPIPVEFQGKTLKSVNLNDNEKVIALTFDDGPSEPYTQQILAILNENNIKGTFFVVGSNLKNYPQLGQQIVAEGHLIANHTWSHSYRHFSPAGAAREINDTAELIYQTTGVKTSIFRPPGGFLDNGPAHYAKKQNYFVALWSADSSDWKRPSVTRLINNVLREAKPGGMVLMHDGGGSRWRTVKALPFIISEFKKRGYKFVTVAELLEIKDKEEQVLANKANPTAVASAAQTFAPQKSINSAN